MNFLVWMISRSGSQQKKHKDEMAPIKTSTAVAAARIPNKLTDSAILSKIGLAQVCGGPCVTGFEVQNFWGSQIPEQSRDDSKKVIRFFVSSDWNDTYSFFCEHSMNDVKTGSGFCSEAYTKLLSFIDSAWFAGHNEKSSWGHGQ